MRAGGAPALLVGALDGFAQQGGMVELVNVNDALRFDVNLAALRNAHLGLSSQVLKLARQLHDMSPHDAAPTPATLTLRARLSRLIAFCAGLTALLCMLGRASAPVGGCRTTTPARRRRRSAARCRTRSQAPVAFEDRKGIADALAPLRAQPQVSGAWVYADDGRLLGHYGRGEPPRPGQFRGSLAAGYLISDEPVEADGMTVGRMVLVHELDHLWQALATALLAIALGSLAGFAASVWLAQRIARAIVQPIATLAQAADAITTSHDYSRRLPAGGRDEVGAAVNAFNGMLDEIRLRGDALLDANRDLEQRVADRTLALQREKERAEAASIAKTRFLANMSHELRTPLNAVIGAAQLLQDGSGSPDHQSYLVSAIHDGGTKLLGLIENILDLSRIETGALRAVDRGLQPGRLRRGGDGHRVGRRARQAASRWPCIVDPRCRAVAARRRRCGCARCCSTCSATP